MTTAAVRPAVPPLPVSRGRLWTGRTLSAIAILFLLMDATIHVLRIQAVAEAFDRLGVPLGLALAIGVLELACVLVYALPRTAVVGAVLLTGYLGGAVAIQLRAGSPLFAETLFPVYVGVLVWGGLLLRRPGLLDAAFPPRA